MRLSQWTAVKQLNRHADVSVDDYRRVQRMLDEGQPFADGNSIVAYFQDGPRWWSAVVKATDTGDELYLVTYLRVAERQLERARRRFTRIGQKENGRPGGRSIPAGLSPERRLTQPPYAE